jgi:hypothetical protein
MSILLSESCNLDFSSSSLFGKLSAFAYEILKSFYLFTCWFPFPKFQESIWISIKLNVKDKVIVGCAYNSPSSKQENLDELKSLMRNVSQMDKEYSNVLIMDLKVIAQWSLCPRGLVIIVSYTIPSSFVKMRSSVLGSLFSLVRMNSDTCWYR